MNTGIQDAYNLGWKLALVVRGEAPAGILDSYEQERHPVGIQLLKTTDRMFAVLAGGGRLGLAVRRVLPAFGVGLIRFGVIGRRVARFISQTGIRYRHSALSTEAHGALRLPGQAPHAGDRAPDAVLGGGAGCRTSRADHSTPCCCSVCAPRRSSSASRPSRRR